MKSLYRVLGMIILLAGFASVASATEQQWKGQISDSTCGISHGKQLVAHPLPNPTPENCGRYCIKNGAQYVFVFQGKVYKIANQKFALLTVQIGHTVLLTGEMNAAGDTITVTHMIVPPTQVRIPVQIR